MHRLLRAGVWIALAIPATGQGIRSEFEFGATGWSCSNSTFELRKSGGTPGGFLFVDNSEGDVAWCLAPPEFTGNLSWYDGGRFSFDGNLLLEQARYWSEQEAVPFGGNYGTLRITGGGMTVSRDLAPGKPTQGAWTNYSISMTAAAWGVTQAQWETILSNVTSIELNVEALFGEEQEGLDNIILLPNTGVLSIVRIDGEAQPRYGQRVDLRTHAVGGTPPYEWSVEGRVPQQIHDPIPIRSNQASVMWNGGYAEEGEFEFNFVVTDSQGEKASRPFRVTVAPPKGPTLSMKSPARITKRPNEVLVLAGGDPLEKLTYWLDGDEGKPPYRYSWDLSDGRIPLDTEYGGITGNVARSAFAEETTMPATARIEDSEGRSAELRLMVRVLFPPEILDAEQLPDARVGQRYEIQLHRRYGGEERDISWLLPDPAFSGPPKVPVPGGLQLSRNGLVSGTPTAAGDFEMEVSVYNSELSVFGHRTFKIKVLPPLSSPETGAKVSHSRVSCESVARGEAASTAAITSTGGETGVDAAGAASWLRVPAQPPATPGRARPSFNSLQCDPGGLSPGLHQTTIRVDGKPVGVDFWVKEPAPEIEYAPERIEIKFSRGQQVKPFKSQLRMKLDTLSSTRVTKVDIPKFTGKVSSEYTVTGNAPLTVSEEIKESDVPAGEHISTELRTEVSGAGIISVPLNVFRTEKNSLEVRPHGFVSAFPDLRTSDVKSVFLTNPSSVPIPWRVESKGPAAATARPASGTLAPGATQVINVTVPPPAAGTTVSSGALEIKGGGATRSVVFTVEQQRVAAVRMTPASLVFGSGLVVRESISDTAPAVTNNGTQTSATLRNFSSATQSYSCYLPPNSGFTMTPTSGSLAAGAAATLNVTATLPATGLTEADAICAVGENVTRLHLIAFSRAGGCTPNRLLPQLETPAPNQRMEAGKTYPIQAVVLDNCGTPVEDAFAYMQLRRPWMLEHVGGGRYSGEFRGETVDVNPGALHVVQGNMLGLTQVQPLVNSNLDRVPWLEDNAPRSAGSLGAALTPAAGSILTLSGKGLADATEERSTSPSPFTLGGASVTIGGTPMPLLFASAEKIQAMVLHNVPRFVPLELVVQRGNLRSAPATVIVGDAAPDLFTFQDGDTKLGVLLNSDSQQVTRETKLKRGTTGILLASGLGSIFPELSEYQQTAEDARVLEGSLTLRIGGYPAQVVFAGLRSGSEGMYQLDFVVPQELQPGTHPVVLNVKGKESNLVLTVVE